jgi:hypothetical protein
MYVDQTGGVPSSGAGWSVDPAQVQLFADTVAEVKDQLEGIKKDVDGLSTPDYAPMLGTSPVGQELAEKFSNRMGSEKGLRGQLNLAITHLWEFVLAAENTAATYVDKDQGNASNYKY